MSRQDVMSAHWTKAVRALGVAVTLGAASSVAFAQPVAVPIGALLDFTGPLAEFGPSHRDAAELAAAHVNAAATEVFGGPIIELIFEDAATSASVGIDRARKLVDVDGVPAIVGPLASGVAVAVAEAVTAPAGVLQISQSATSPLLSILEDDDFLFRTIGSDALQASSPPSSRAARSSPITPSPVRRRCTSTTPTARASATPSPRPSRPGAAP